MAKTRAIVITGNGTNCEMEAAHACRLGGFDDVFESRELRRHTLLAIGAGEMGHERHCTDIAM